MTAASALPNLVFAAVFAGCAYYDWSVFTARFGFLPVPSLGYFSKLIWLTLICLYLQIIYHSIAGVFALLRFRRSTSGGVRRLLGTFATCILYPLSLTVVVLFWGLTLASEAHLMDERERVILSMHLINHTLHTLPAFVVLVDSVNWHHPRPPKHRAFALIAVFIAVYTSWIHYVAHFHGYWAYPILRNLDPVSRSLFMVGCSGVFFGAFLVSDWLNGWIQALEELRNQLQNFHVKR